MSPEQNHPLLDFATRYGDPSQDYLNAYMALARLENLLDDLAKVQRLLDAGEPEGTRWAPWFGAEIVSYYAVGMVTCLEWHAKSRLIDLLTFMPSALQISDVKGTVSDKLIVQMVAKQATVVQLIGAAIKIGSFEAYIASFDRLFASLDFPFKVSDWLSGASPEATVCWIQPHQFETIREMFSFRHELVHEIGMATMGHPNVRDGWSPMHAKEVGLIVTALLHGIEAAITTFAPTLFPNKLDDDRWPVFITQSLSIELERLDILANKLVKVGDWNASTTWQAWEKARDAFKTYMDFEMEFIEKAEMLHWRYMDARTPLRTKLLRYRISFLEEVLSHCSLEETNSAEEGDIGPKVD